MALTFRPNWGSLTSARRSPSATEVMTEFLSEEPIFVADATRAAASRRPGNIPWKSHLELHKLLSSVFVLS